MRRAAGIAVAVALAWPALARACAVCGAGEGDNRATFFWTTVLLSLLPLGLFAAGIAWLRRSLGPRLREEFAERDAIAEAGSPPAP